MAVQTRPYLATPAQIKRRAGVEGTALDALIEQLAASVTYAIENIVGRKLRYEESITEVHTGGKKIINLRQPPIITITSIREADQVDQDWTDSDLYTALTEHEDFIHEPGGRWDGENGQLHRLSANWIGNNTSMPGMVQVIYTGGWHPPDDVGNTNTDMPFDLINACAIQVTHELATRMSPGRRSDSMRGVSVASGASQTFDKASMLPQVVEIAKRYMRYF